MPITPCRPKWKGTMTDRERFCRQLRYKPIGRCFNMEFGYWGANCSLWSIKAYMETLVPFVERGGYIPFCDHRCPPDVKEDDYLYYLDLKEQMFGMK